jgi:hypothetical protein
MDMLTVNRISDSLALSPALIFFFATEIKSFSFRNAIANQTDGRIKSIPYSWGSAA